MCVDTNFMYIYTYNFLMYIWLSIVIEYTIIIGITILIILDTVH